MLKIMLVLCVFLPMSSYAGQAYSASVINGQERGGGSEVEREFVKVSQMASSVIKNNIQHGSHLFDGFNISAFISAIDKVEVYGLQRVCEANSIDPNTGVIAPGRCLDAQYFPERNRIEFDINIWNTKTCMQKISLVTHEYGRASGNEGGNYKFSSKIDQIEGLYTECDAYDRELNTLKTSCQAKSQFLGDALHKHDGDATSSVNDRNAYLVTINNIFVSWKAGVGRECVSQGMDLCVRVCSPKADAACFSVCR